MFSGGNASRHELFYSDASVRDVERQALTPAPTEIPLA
jgi:hypothetical protein